MITVGVVGLGRWGPNLARNLSASPRTELAWLCDRDPERLERVGRHYPSARRCSDLATMLADPELDAVAIATPVPTHFELARDALRAGRHVLVEKPLATASAQGAELVRLAAGGDRILLVDHVYVHAPAVVRMGELYRAGEIGDILFFDSVRINLGSLRHDASVLWDLAPHDLSILDHLIEREPASVLAVGSRSISNGVEDLVHLHLDYGDGLLASLHLNWLSPVKVRHVLVGGSQRSVLYNELDPMEPLKVYDRGIDVSSDPSGPDPRVSYRFGDVVSPHLAAAEPLAQVVEHFAACIEDGVVPISGGAQGLRILRVLEAAEESLASGSARVRLAPGRAVMAGREV